MTTIEQRYHHLDPMTRTERTERDAEALADLAAAGECGQVAIESTYCGAPCWTYRVGDFSGSGRYRYVGAVRGGKVVDHYARRLA